MQQQAVIPVESTFTQRRFHLLQWVELPWVLCFAPLLLLPGTFLPLHWHLWLVPLLFLFWVLQRLFDPVALPVTLVDIPILVLLVCFLIGIWIAVDQPLAWEVTGYLTFGIALFLALLSWPPTRTSPALILWALMVAGNSATLLGISAVGPQLSHLLAWLSLSWVDAGVITGLVAVSTKLMGVVNHNIFASVSALLFPLYLALFLHWQRNKSAWLIPLWAILSLGVVILLILSKSRGSLLAASVGGMVVIFIRWPRSIYLLIFTPFLVAAILSIFGETAVTLQAQSAFSMAGLSGRQDIWYRALLALHDFSFTGIGIGMFGKVIPALYPYSVLQNTNLPHAHNLFLQVGLDLGVPGLLAYISIWLNIVFLLSAVLRKSQQTSDRTYAIGAVGSATALLVNGLVDIALWDTKLAFIPWMLLAFALQLGVKVTYNQKRRRTTRPSLKATG